MQACAGTVTVTARAGVRTLRTRVATLAARGGACRYATTLTIPARALRGVDRVTFAASFAGNDRLLPTTARLGSPRGG